MDPELLARIQALIRERMGPFEPPRVDPTPSLFTPGARRRYFDENPRPERERQPLLPQGLKDSLVGIGNTINQAVNPLSPGFFDRGIPGFAKDMVQDIQQHPFLNLTPAGDVDAIRSGHELTQAGHPWMGAGMGALGAFGSLPIAGMLVGSLEKEGARAGRRLLARAAETGEETRLRHYGRGSLKGKLEVSKQGTGQPGAEARRRGNDPEGFLPRNFFYAGDTPAEPRFAGQPMSEARLDTGLILNEKDSNPFFQQALAELEEEGIRGGPMLQTRMEQVAREQGFEAIQDARGVVHKFTDTDLETDVIEQGSAMQQLQQEMRDRRAGQQSFEGPDRRSVTGEAPATLEEEAFRREAQAGAILGVDQTALARAPLMGAGDEAISPVALLERQLFAEDQARAIAAGPKPDLPTPDELFGPGRISAEEYRNIDGPKLPERPATAVEAAATRLKFDNKNKTNRAARRQAIEQGLTPEELAQLTKGNRKLQQTVEENYSKLPTPVAFAHAAIRGAESRGWYLGSGQAIRESFGQHAPRFTALLAAMSPQKSVEENLKQALHVWGGWNRAGRPSDAQSIEAIMRQSIGEMGINPLTGEPRGVLPADINNSIRALMASEDALKAGHPSLLNGPKVGPFYANLLGAVNPIVNDTHMARGYGTMASRVGTKGRNLAQNSMVRNAAKEFERITGHAVDPREIQEMSWAYIRGLTNAAGEKGAALDAIEQSFLEPAAKFAGDISVDDRIKNSVSLGHLMSQPEFAQALEIAGVRAPTPRAPTGIPGLDPKSADINALRDIAERIDLVRNKKPLYSAVPLGLYSAAQTGRQKNEKR